VIVRNHGDFGAVAGVARRSFDFYQALADFRHFELEQHLPHPVLMLSLFRPPTMPAHFRVTSSETLSL
jgi:hypothetical protein